MTFFPIHDPCTGRLWNARRGEDLLLRWLINEGGYRPGVGVHEPGNETCDCGICTTPTELLAESEEKELDVYLRMAFTGERPPWDNADDKRAESFAERWKERNRA